ncbi:hypothetical protein [Sphingomonas sp.]
MAKRGEHERLEVTSCDPLDFAGRRLAIVVELFTVNAYGTKLMM